MIHASVWQIILVCIVLAVWYGGAKCSQNYSKYFESVFCGFFVGLIFGEPATGLYIGGTVQLMSMGLYQFGGATVPNYPFGAAMGTAIACLSGRGIDYALTIALPAAALMMQMDMLYRTITIYFAKRAESAIDKENYRAMQLWVYLACLVPIMTVEIPAVIVLLNADSIDAVINMLPSWFMYGMKCAGGMLPAVGMAVLLRYMNIKQYWPYLILGFVLITYLALPIFGAALLGLVIAAVYFMQVSKKPVIQNAYAGGEEDEDEL